MKPGLSTQIPTAFDSLHIESFGWNRKMSVMAILRQLLLRFGKETCFDLGALVRNRNWHQNIAACEKPYYALTPLFEKPNLSGIGRRYEIIFCFGNRRTSGAREVLAAVCQLSIRPDKATVVSNS
jgi:hypothetical protein